ncbi:MAG: FAD-dependent oxidoreductase [Robiginitomaculum sp.]|nr:MAG: FAD-dependent oxidoreductase [Robiginitomaculum sp.]
MTKQYDYLIIGSGINALICASLLAKKGLKVCILEREDKAGGCIKTGEVTQKGFKHDLMSGFYPEFLASKAYEALGDDLHAHGLEFLNTQYPTASLLPNGRYFILKTDRAENIKALNALHAGDGDSFAKDMDDFGANAHLTFGLLGNEVMSFATLKMLANEMRKNGLTSLTNFFGKASRSARTWLDAYKSEEARACFAPWVLHAGMDIDGAMSGYMGRVFAFALEAVGMPVVKGGSENIVKAFESFLVSKNCAIKTNIYVKKITVKSGRAVSLIDSKGVEYFAKKGIICNTTPTQLYGENSLIPREFIPEPIKTRTQNYQYGRGNMIIHLALAHAPHWPHPDLAKTAMIHISDNLAQTTQSLADTRNGLLPKRATIAVGQKVAIDPSRAPDGKFSLWLQLHEIPRDLKGDAAGKIDTQQGWNENVREAYADRIISQLEEFAPGLRELILARNVYSPIDLEKLNMNLVGGDPYSGANTVDQFLLWRPLRGLKGHRTPVKNVYHIGASTHPGPGLGGTSGFLVGSQLK